MTRSRKALNDLSNMVGEYYNDTREHRVAVNTIKQDLERKEELEKENQELRIKANKYDAAQRIVLSTKGIDVLMKLQAENEKLKKAIEILKETFEFEIKQRDGKYYIDYCIVLSNELIEENAIALKEVLE